MNFSIRHIIFLVIVGLSISLISMPLTTNAQTITFTKIVGTGTGVPGETGRTFGRLGVPSINNGNVAFWGRDVFSLRQGIYRYVGGVLNRVVDNSMLVPGGSGKNFQDLSNPSYIDNNGNVAFWGRNRATPVPTGIYIGNGGPLTIVVDYLTKMPDSTEAFSLFSGKFSLDNGNVVFPSLNPFGLEGIYARIGGSLGVIADENTLIPGESDTFDRPAGGGQAAFLDEVDIDGEDVVFVGRGKEQEGIYTSIGGSLNIVADKNTQIPGRSGNFSRFRWPSIDNGYVAFFALGGGIVTNIGGSLNVIVDRTTLIPGQPFSFYNMGFISLDAGNVAFLGSACALCGYGGIFVHTNGSVIKVIDNHDLLEGKTTSSLSIGQQGLSGDQIVFHASFTDGTQGIFVATVDALSSDLPGSSQDNPILPDLCDLPPIISLTLFCFDDIPSDQWVDPPMAFGYRYEMISDSLFTGILDFPTGFDNLFTVIAEGTQLPGAFGPGDSVDFGEGVSKFTVTGISPLVDGEQPDAFPIKLAFSTPTASFTMQALISVSIDIKPGSDPNCFNINGHGVIPVAILGSADLDVYDIKTDDTLSFNGLAVRVRGKKGALCAIEDLNEDEFPDLVCHFEDDTTQWEVGNDGNATLTGKLLDGTPIEGSDSICIVP